MGYRVTGLLFSKCKSNPVTHYWVIGLLFMLSRQNDTEKFEMENVVFPGKWVIWVTSGTFSK